MGGFCAQVNIALGKCQTDLRLSRIGDHTLGNPRSFIPMAKVYVVHQNGQPLMPTHPAKARILLKSGRAKVVSREPSLFNFYTKPPMSARNLTAWVDPVLALRV
jgi:hypothetical protein